MLCGIQSAPTAEGNITNSPLNGSVVQTNVQSNVHGGIVVNGQTFSQEALAIAKIYGEIDVRYRSELLAFAFSLADKAAKNEKS